MKHTYLDLIQQSYAFPQEGFDLEDNHLTFHGVSIKKLIEKYGTPFRCTYLPSIGQKIQKARALFQEAIAANNYQGNYEYCYCTKTNHFHHIVSETLQQKVNLETSSALDIELILQLHQQQKLPKSIVLIHNGYKTQAYLRQILKLQAMGFYNSIIVLDNKNELKQLLNLHQGSQSLKIGLRMAINEEIQSAYYTSRLGIRQNEILSFFNEAIKDNPRVELHMLHFFVDSGMQDSLYYWGQLKKALRLYTTIKKASPTLNAFNLGGGLPIRNNLRFKYDYAGIINKLVATIKKNCDAAQVPHPTIHTEFGKYTVGESSAIIFEVLDAKRQNDTETWYIINNSLLNTIPDAWSIHEKFILLPINHWHEDYQRVNIGGISCDRSDYYNSEDLNQEILLPTYSEQTTTPLYLGFFHTGAYQNAISGYGGIKHCLINMPQQIILDKDEAGNLIDYVFEEDTSLETLLKTLGYS